jgi:hypothetical protein
MKRFLSILLIAFCSVPLAFAAKASAFLPTSFNGWQKQAPTTSSDPAAVDKADADVLKEYGFSSVEQATYTRGDRKMQVKAASFNDASGALGAYSYYVLPQMQKEDIPDRAASNNSRVLFFRGNILVDVTLDRVTAMSAGDLRALSDALPHPHGGSSVLPPLANSLPPSYVPNSARYIVGPVALERLGVPIPPALIDFSKGAEVEFAQYRKYGVDENLTVISYPTPQIAAERMNAMKAASIPNGPFEFKKSGPLLAIVNGHFAKEDADALLASMNYDAEVTWNQATRQNPKDNIGNLIVGVFTLIGLLVLVGVVLGLAFGGVRVMAKKLFPNRVFDRPEDVEIIRLNLK